MGRPNDYYRVLALLQQLHISYPNYNMGRHIATALDEYGDVWGLSDREILFALEKYKAELDLEAVAFPLGWAVGVQEKGLVLDSQTAKSLYDTQVRARHGSDMQSIFGVVVVIVQV